MRSLTLTPGVTAERKIGEHFQLHDGSIRKIHRSAPRSIGALLGILGSLRFKACFFLSFLFNSFSFPLAFCLQCGGGTLLIIRRRDYLYTYNAPLPGFHYSRVFQLTIRDIFIHRSAYVFLRSSNLVGYPCHIWQHLIPYHAFHGGGIMPSRRTDAPDLEMVA